MNINKEKTKIGIIGVGAVGSTTAFALLTHNLVDEMILIDKDKEKASGEALDISHCIPFVSPQVVKQGDYQDLADADIVIITASIPMSKELGSRMELLEKNIDIVKDTSYKLKSVGFDGIVIVISNPVDILSYFYYKYLGLPRNQVIGSGTVLDSMRFRHNLGKQCNIDPRSIHAYILGEHGDSEVPIWSQANIAGMNLRDACNICEQNCGPEVFDKMFHDARTAAYRIIKGKGATNYAIAMSTVLICRAIIKNENRVLPVSTLINDYLDISDVYLSVPTVVNRQGVRDIIKLKMNDEEKEALQKSANILKEQVEKHLKKANV
ncbi:MAG: L-lactate dehydrogenase [Vulcanimicrobiota bacterium]